MRVVVQTNVEPQCADEGPQPRSPRLYYVMSLKWTAGEHITWWGPNNSGYTVDLARAGTYTAAEVARAGDYYDSGREADGTLAIPVESVERFVRPVRYVPNDRSVYRALRRARNRARHEAARATGPLVAATPIPIRLDEQKASHD